MVFSWFLKQYLPYYKKQFMIEKYKEEKQQAGQILLLIYLLLVFWYVSC